MQSIKYLTGLISVLLIITVITYTTNLSFLSDLLNKNKVNTCDVSILPRNVSVIPYDSIYDVSQPINVEIKSSIKSPIVIIETSNDNVKITTDYNTVQGGLKLIMPGHKNLLKIYLLVDKSYENNIIELNITLKKKGKVVCSKLENITIVNK